MRIAKDHQIIYSSSDLMNFLRCPHLTVLDAKNLLHPLPTAEPDAILPLLQKLGYQHEEQYLEQLQQEGKHITKLSGKGSYRTLAQQTLEAMQSGVDVIYQATFIEGIWNGHADFLLKCNTPSSLGNFSYEVADTKLAKYPKAEYITQLCMYTDFVATLQGVMPKQMYLVLGNNEKMAFKVEEYYHYYQHVRALFEKYCQALPPDSYPQQCQHCRQCRWSHLCQEQWEHDQHLNLVANIRQTDISKLNAAGINSLPELANIQTPPEAVGITSDRFFTLQTQASLQHQSRQTGKPIGKTLKTPLEFIGMPHGFTRLPPPDAHDLFFDMEGDPLYPQGLEYLLGVYYNNGSGFSFKPFWAHDHCQEKQSLEQFIQFTTAHLNAHPAAHIYHYNHYEVTALKRLCSRYAVGEEQLDNYLRGDKFVDLYKVVRESILISQPSYSLKDLEVFYMPKRQEAVANAGDSIVIYNQWRESQDDKLLQDIADYNEQDCKSTHLLHQWLLKLKPDNSGWLHDFREPSVASEQTIAQAEEYQIASEQIEAASAQTPEFKQRLINLLEFHARENKRQWWDIFARAEATTEEIIDDADCLGGLQLIDAADCLYSFPAQETKLKEGNEVYHTTTFERVGTITAITTNDEQHNRVLIKPARQFQISNKLSIGPPPPINSQILRRAIYEVARQFITTPHAKPNRVAIELLNKNPPRYQQPPAANSQLIDKISQLNNSYFIIQGPPGTGKTHTSAHLIVSLMQQGKKIGVSSNSHKAIHNLLQKVQAVASEQRFKFSGVKKATNRRDDTYFSSDFFTSVTRVADIESDANLIAGTAWTFANEHLANRLDYLFIDEAGQVVAANVIAMSPATQNIVLVGDHRQLGQPTQGVHPEEAGLSILEFLLSNQTTVSEQQGQLLDSSYRLHPDLSQFISDTFYNSRLGAHPSTRARQLKGRNTGLPNQGVAVVLAQHQNCVQKSEEEAQIIAHYYQQLIGQTFIDQNGQRQITPDDILVIAPYNMQVNHLQTQLPLGARIGTIDKFQGQEAPITLISMTTSSPDNLSRQMDFLYSGNRLNVAISRAQCLAVIVLNPALLTAKCRSIDDIKLVNTFCKLYHTATVIDHPPPTPLTKDK